MRQYGTIRIIFLSKRPIILSNFGPGERGRNGAESSEISENNDIDLLSVCESTLWGQTLF